MQRGSWTYREPVRRHQECYRTSPQPPPPPQAIRNLGRVQAAMQDAMDHASNMRAVAKAVAEARASQAKAAAEAAEAAQQGRPPRRVKPKPPTPPTPSAEDWYRLWRTAHNIDPRTVSAKVVGWEVKAKGAFPPVATDAAPPLQLAPVAKPPPPTGPAAARLIIRVRMLPPDSLDRALRATRAPVMDGTALQSDPNIADLANGGPPAFAFFNSGATVFIFHEGLWYYRQGTVFTDEIHSSIFFDAEIEHVDS